MCVRAVLEKSVYPARYSGKNAKSDESRLDNTSNSIYIHVDGSTGRLESKNA